MTLEQLIEACGDNVRGVYTANRQGIEQCCVVDTRAKCFYGLTAIEAFQNLYDYLKENNLI